MVLSYDEKVLIKNLYMLKRYGPAKLTSEFPDKNWKWCGLEELLKKLWETGIIEWKRGSGTP